MRVFSAKNAARNFGHLMDAAREGPVEIHKHGRRACVLMAYRDFAEYETLKFANVREQIIRSLGEALDAASNDDVQTADRIMAKMPKLWRRGLGK